MLLKTFNQAQKQGWAIGHFNFSTLEQLRGIASAAKELSSPVIVATSEREVAFLGLEETIALVRILESKIDFRLFLHLDHGRDLKLVKKAIDYGYDSVHFDGSCLSFKQNVKLTREVVRYARKKNVLVEGELGYLRGESKLFSRGKPRIKKEDLTKPEQVREFERKTGVDCLAIAIGAIHGAYFKESKPDYERLNFERLKEIREESDGFLVLHGGSGVSPKELKKAIKMGIQKININTALRKVWEEALQKALEKTKEVKPYLVLPKVDEAVAHQVKKYIKLMGASHRL